MNTYVLCLIIGMRHVGAHCKCTMHHSSKLLYSSFNWYIGDGINQRTPCRDERVESAADRPFGWVRPLLGLTVLLSADRPMSKASIHQTESALLCATAVSSTTLPRLATRWWNDADEHNRLKIVCVGCMIWLTLRRRLWSRSKDSVQIMDCSSTSKFSRKYYRFWKQHFRCLRNFTIIFIFISF